MGKSDHVAFHLQEEMLLRTRNVVLPSEIFYLANSQSQLSHRSMLEIGNNEFPISSFGPYGLCTQKFIMTHIRTAVTRTSTRNCISELEEHHLKKTPSYNLQQP